MRFKKISLHLIGHIPLYTQGMQDEYIIWWQNYLQQIFSEEIDFTLKDRKSIDMRWY